MGLWLPPERTFSQISRAAFQPERVDHVEISAERQWAGMLVIGVRAFRQNVEDQTVTMFGLALLDSVRGVGHYHVGSAGDFSAQGWGERQPRGDEGFARLGRLHPVNDAVVRQLRDAQTLAALAPATLRDNERVHDMTATFDSVVAPSATRVFVSIR